MDAAVQGVPTRRQLIAGAAGATLFANRAVAQPQSIEVVHWWVSGGESEAIRTIRRKVEATGLAWVDTAVAGPDVAKAAALTRALGGAAPTVMLWHVGLDLVDLYRDGVIGDVQQAANADGWDAVLPPEISKRLKVDGRYVAVPADLHCGNWAFANLRLLREASVDIPTTWPAVLTACARLQGAGVVPIAFGGQAWQEASVFVMILTGVGGARLLRRFTVDHDLTAADDHDLVAAFEIFAAMKPFVDKSSANRSSTDTANLFATNRAALHFAGDWARGDINKAGMQPGKDYTCGPAPGNEGIFMAVVDAFCMTRSTKPEVLAAQNSFARITMSAEVQHDFNLLKGAIPVRTDVAMTGYDEFALTSAALSRGGGQIIPSTSMGMTTAMRLGFYEVVHRFWNTDRADSKLAARDFRAALDRNRS